MNIVALSGTLPKDSDRRELASGEVLVQFDLATPLEGRSVTVPVSWPVSSERAGLVGGDSVVVVGIVQRRFFRAGGTTQSRTEVVASTVVKATHRRRVEQVLTEAVQGIEGG